MTVRLPKLENVIINLFFSTAVKRGFSHLKTRKPPQNQQKIHQIQQKIKNFRFLTNIFPFFRIYINNRKKLKVRIDAVDKMFKNPMEDTFHSLIRVEDPEMRAQVTQAVERLSGKERTVMLLHHYSDLSVEQTAEAMKITGQRVAKHLVRAQERVFDEVGEKYMSSFDTTYDSSENSTLRQLFDEHAAETITDEQLNRIIAPIGRMINAGCFNSKPKRRSLCWVLSPLSQMGRRKQFSKATKENKMTS